MTFLTGDKGYMTRAEAIAIEPSVLVGVGSLGHDLSEEARTVAPIALFEQLRDEGAPIEGLEMWIALVHRHAETKALDAATIEFVRAELSFIAGDYVRFAAWARALGEAIVDDVSLLNALGLIVEARQSWLLTDALRRSDPPVPAGSDSPAPR
jgi:hypothetical protein